MAKIIRVAPLLPASTASSDKFKSSPLASIVLFCGIGLLVSLLALLMGVSGAWY